MVVLPYTGASRYHNCCIDGGTSPEYFGKRLVITAMQINVAVPQVSAFLGHFREDVDNEKCNTG
jgi:hypothetical protein